MTRLAWGDAGTRLFETGIDRGVLYVDPDFGVPWNGLKGVDEQPSGGEPRPYYVDGYKYLNIASAEEYAATLKAYSAPADFRVCDGMASVHNGLFATQQPRLPFNLSYRTLVGNDVKGEGFAYKIHLVYNALAKPATRTNNSTSNAATPLELAWALTTQPPLIQGLRPTAHFIIDSTLTPKKLLEQVEDILYGNEGAEPRIMPVEEVIQMFNDYVETPPSVGRGYGVGPYGAMPYGR